MTTAATLLFDTASPATKPAAAISGTTGPNAAAQAPFAALLADGGVLQVSNLGQLVAANAPVSGSDFLGLGIVDGADRPLEGEAGVFALLTSTALTAPAPTAKAPGGLLGAALPATPLTGHAPAAPASPQHATGRRRGGADDRPTNQGRRGSARVVPAGVRNRNRAGPVGGAGSRGGAGPVERRAFRIDRHPGGGFEGGQGGDGRFPGFPRIASVGPCANGECDSRGITGAAGHGVAIDAAGDADHRISFDAR